MIGRNDLCWCRKREKMEKMPAFRRKQQRTQTLQIFYSSLKKLSLFFVIDMSDYLFS